VHDRIGVLPQHADLASLRAQVVLEPPGRESRVPLVEVAGHQIEPDRGPLAEPLEQMEHRQGVLAAGDGDQDAVAVLDQGELLDGAACLVEEPLEELAIGLRLSHAGPLVTPTRWQGSTCGCPKPPPGPCSSTRPASTATPAGRWPRRSTARCAASPTSCASRNHRARRGEPFRRWSPARRPPSAERKAARSGRPW